MYTSFTEVSSDEMRWLTLQYVCILSQQAAEQHALDTGNNCFFFCFCSDGHFTMLSVIAYSVNWPSPCSAVTQNRHQLMRQSRTKVWKDPNNIVLILTDA